MYDCKLMELGERSLWSGWAAGRSFLWWMADGGCRTPGRRVPVGYDSAGGELILGWRKSALFLKSPLSEI